MLSLQTPIGASRAGSRKPQRTSDLARFALDLDWDQRFEELETASGSKAYPSPPMSGSLPPNSTGASIRGETGHTQAHYQTASSQDIYHGDPPTSEPRGLPSINRSVPGPYRQSPHNQGSYAYARHEAGPTRPVFPSMPPAIGQSVASAPYYPPTPGGSSSSHVGSARPPTMESQPYTSPKSQRKTKGHVASACVPCKKAHLRCDSQRPCARCSSNGKEDACIDVQHKKRGRPRLRDDRESRYDSTRMPHPHDAGMRRPLQAYPALAPPPSGYDDAFRRGQTYRVLKSQPSDAGPSRHWDRASASDASIHMPPLSIATRPPEPVVYLTLNLEIAKVSPTFMDILRGVDIVGRKLLDIVAPSDRDRVNRLQTALQDEQKAEQPNYLPPILDRGPQILQGLGMAAEDVGRYKLDHQEYINFVTIDGQIRPFLMRFGLAREASFYFLVGLVSSPPTARYPYPSPSPHARDGPGMYHGQPRTPQAPLTQHTPVSATFEPSRTYMSDTRPPVPLSAGLTSRSPGLSGGGPAYTATPTRPDFPGPSPTYAMPRNAPLPLSRPTNQSYQLPPIRPSVEENNPPPSAGEPPSYLRDAYAGPYEASRPNVEQHREDRPPEERSSGRVDIGGLIDRPDDAGHSR